MRNLVFAFSLLCALLLTGVVLAQSAPRSEMVEALAKDHGERPVAWGLATGNQMVIEVFRTRNGSKWTIVVTDRSNQSTIVVFGANWVDTPFKDFPCSPGSLCLEH
jgi:hypothetical protein